MLPNFVSLARERILAPLGIEHDAMFNPPPSLRPRIAATEWGQRYEAKMARMPAARRPVVSGQISRSRNAKV